MWLLLCRGPSGFVMIACRLAALPPCRRLIDPVSGEDLAAAGGEIWADLQEALGRLASKPRSALAAGLVAYPFGLVPGAIGIVRPDIQRVVDSEFVAEPDVVVEVFDLGAGLLMVASSSQWLPLSP